MTNQRFQYPVRPLALTENTVVGDTYRFTVLTPSLIRLEYDAGGVFEDRASQSVFYRDFDKVAFTVSRENGVVVVETDELLLTYTENAPFAADTLSLKLKNEPASLWHFGDSFENFGGTAKTLDGVDGETILGDGVCSRWGFSLLDDSSTMVLDDTGWVALRRANTVDIYFFGYGYRYLDAVADYFRLTGVPPMLPQYALGNWWSRYHAYTQQEYMDLMTRFKEEDMPFSVGVVDMDWHVVKIPPEQQDPTCTRGWTGYSWNKELFPDYRAFLKFLHKNNLRTALNLHPADGIRRHEDMYPQMAKACGIDPATGERVKFDILSRDFMEKYFDIVHHPYEQDGVDFWWMDWQQGTDYHWIHEPNKDGEMQNELEVLDPLWMLNHLHIMDISRDGKRPMFFSRFSGAGSQRYPVGFSGDTFCTWESLKFQPYFTVNSSNIGYCWWSHDIGGHQRGFHNGDLLTRWLQFGVFSPINRIHSASSRFQQKEPWQYNNEIAPVMKSLLKLRHDMFPYIYTMNYRTHADLQPLMQPMYYQYPKCNAAYEVPNQYFFGSELVVAPITEERHGTSHLSGTTAWIPAGDWFDFFDGTHYAGLGGRKMRVYRRIENYPVFAKAGAIVPMARFEDNRLYNTPDMDVVVFAGADNAFTLYEDEGEGNRFETENAYATTDMALAWDTTAAFTIYPAQGDLTLIPKKRNWHIKLRGFAKDVVLTVTVNGKKAKADIAYTAADNTTTVCVAAKVTDTVSVDIAGETLITDNGDVKDRVFDILQYSDLDHEFKSRLYNTLTDRSKSIKVRLSTATANAAEAQQIVDACREQLTLTEPEFVQGDVHVCF